MALFFDTLTLKLANFAIRMANRSPKEAKDSFRSKIKAAKIFNFLFTVKILGIRVSKVVWLAVITFLIAYIPYFYFHLMCYMKFCTALPSALPFVGTWMAGIFTMMISLCCLFLGGLVLMMGIFCTGKIMYESFIALRSFIKWITT